jgi:hypothetical protein
MTSLNYTSYENISHQWDCVSLDEFKQSVFADGALVDSSSIVELLKEHNKSVFGLK